MQACAHARTPRTQCAGKDFEGAKIFPKNGEEFCAPTSRENLSPSFFELHGPGEDFVGKILLR